MSMLGSAVLFFNRVRGAVSPNTINGYEHHDLVEVIFRKTVALRDRKLAGRVLDFGGGCGVAYFEEAAPGARWAVVETSAMAARAQALASDHLRFFTSVEDAADWLGDVDIVHSNGALQYVPEPERTVHQLTTLGASRMIWKRTWLAKDGIRRHEKQFSRLADNGPGRLADVPATPVSYTATLMPEREFMALHGGRGYQLDAADGNGGYDFRRP